MKLWIGALVLWLIPLIAMQFTSEMNWGVGDFVAFAVLLVAFVLALQFGLRRLVVRSQRKIFVVVLILGFLAIWAQLAVGLFPKQDVGVPIESVQPPTSDIRGPVEEIKTH